MTEHSFRVRKGLTVANTTASANLDPISLIIGSTIANTTGVYTGISNAATHSVGTAYTANSTVVNAAAVNCRGQVNTVTSYATTSSNVGANVQLTTAQLRVGNSMANTTIGNNSIYIGNSSVNVIANSSGFWGTANNASYLGGVAAASYLTAADLDAYQTEAGLSANVATLTANNANYLGGVAAASYQTEAGLSANVATMTANNANYLGGTAAASYALDTDLDAYQTEAGLSANVATLTANNADYLGGLAAAGYANLSVATFTTSINVAANVRANTTTIRIGNTIVNTTIGNNVIYVGNSTSNATLNSTMLVVQSSNVALTGVENQTITGGATIVEKDLGTVTTGTVTLDMGDRPHQKYVNGGAHTLAPGTTIGNCLLVVNNTTGAGVITTTGWTKVAGDSFTTTTTDKFVCHASVTAAGSLLVVQAMQ